MTLRHVRGVLTTLVGAVLVVTTLAVPTTPARADIGGLGRGQRVALLQIARDTWRFFGDDVDPNTQLPLDNLGPGDQRGNYTSAANVGVYLWAVTAAYDLKIIDRRTAVSKISATLATVRRMKRTYGFLYQWYDTRTAEVIPDPGSDLRCADDPNAATDNCSFLSAVDNGWYASGLVVVRQAFDELCGTATKLIKDMDFSIFYDNRAQTACNVNASIDNQPTGQMYGGAVTPPTGFRA